MTNGRTSAHSLRSGRTRRPPLHLLALLFQELFYFDGGHATSARRSDGLPIAAILHVSAGINAMHTRENIIVSLQIAIGIGIELPFKHLRVWLVTDAEEQGAGGKIPYFACLQVAQLQSGHFVLVDVVNVVHHRVEEKLDLLVFLRALQHDFGSAKSIAPMN